MSDKVITRRSGGFTQIDNEIINNEELTWKAKGLMLYFLSKPDNWKINVRGDVIKRGVEGRDSVYNGINELIDGGYISRVKDDKGYVTYYLFENKHQNDKIDYLRGVVADPENQDMDKKSYPENQEPENQEPENQEPENQDDLIRPKDNNTKCNNNDVINTLSASNDAMHDQVMELVEAWNQIQGYNGIEMTKVQSISKTSARYRATVSRIKEYSFDTVYDVLRKVSKSDFLRGDSRTRWTADFGWVMRPTNFEKILEDTYINKGNGNAECNSNNQQNRKLSEFQEFATELSDRVDKNRHILDELPDDYIF